MKDFLPLLIFAVLGILLMFLSRAVERPKKQEGPGVVGVLLGAIIAAAVTWLLSVYLFK